MLPAFDGLGYGANGFPERLTEDAGDLDLAERRRPDQLVSRA
jgi:hypothetical protein